MLAHMKKEVRFDNVRGCSICYRPAFGNHYGVFSCYACKMFFRRIVVEKLSYKCKKFNKCFGHFAIMPNCTACRFRKCVEVGMSLTPKNEALMEIENPSDFGLSKLLGELTMMESNRYLTLINSYSMEDPSLEDILRNKNAMKIMKRTSNIKITAQEWGFLDVYSRIIYFTSFDFIDALSFNDKKTLFQLNYLNSGLLGAAMQALLERRDMVLSPNGEDVYPEVVRELFKDSPEILNRICCQIVNRLIELKVKNEEYLLLTLIFFCNPATSNQFSDDAKNTLSSYQKMYTSALLQYCQLTYQQSAPSRFADLLSICHVINRTNNDLQFVSMMFQCLVPGYKSKRLVRDTFGDSDIFTEDKSISYDNKIKLEIMK